MTKKISVLIAAASDCDLLRSAVNERFTMENSRLKDVNSFSVFDWRTDTKVGLAANGAQPTIFESAAAKWGKKECDILVLLFWHRYGPGTKEEYEYFADQLKSSGIGSLWVCHYNERVSPKELENSQIDSIFKWTKKPKKNWIELGRIRFSIDNAGTLANAIETEINKFVVENKLKRK
jgi:L-rhamnose isomerase